MLIGTEIEYAAASTSSYGPTFLSAGLVCAYLGLPLPATEVDFTAAWSGPADDLLLADGAPVAALVAGLSAGLPSAFLANGARFYVDHAHPEYSTPECLDPATAAACELAGDRIVTAAAEVLSEILTEESGAPVSVQVFKSNSDGHSNSWGAHENYRLPRRLPWAVIRRVMLPFVVSRQMFCGAGKVGSENGRPPVAFQLSQRADFFTQVESLQTTYDRGIINTRDEPHDDPSRFRRLHLICGDSNRAPYALWLKLAATSLMLHALVDGHFDSALEDWPDLADPTAAIWQVSHSFDVDSGFWRDTPLLLDSGSSATATELQEFFITEVASWMERNPHPDWAPYALDEWSRTVFDLDTDPLSAADRVDWVAKLRTLLDSGIDLASPRAKVVDHMYAQLGPGGVASAIEREGWFTYPETFVSSDVVNRITTPPPGRPLSRAALISAARPDSLPRSVDWAEFVTAEGTLQAFPH